MGTGHTKYDYAHEAVQAYLKKLVSMKVEIGKAEFILQELRTHIYEILPNGLDNCTICIYADSQTDFLKCQIGKGRHEVLINILGEKIKWIIPGFSTKITTESYANDLKEFVKSGA